MKKSFIVGIDEVGRGSLAGPVVVVAVRILKGARFKNKKLGTLKDSKKLSLKQREEWFAHLKAHPQIAFEIARVYPRTIERINISQAANKAALRAFQKLFFRGGAAASRWNIFLDGGLYLGDGTWQKKSTIMAKTVIRGDEKIAVVAVASIIAKVLRDRLMKRLSKKYPQYGFEIHKGYGTARHVRALKKHGSSDMHRLTFLVRYNTIIKGK